uniref:Uncharacterized protein n=1 Tax=Leersia perrieri TaxID=77586 RepID=A0A0D9VKK1_9ORYZ
MPEKIVTAYQPVLNQHFDEDTALNKCNSAVSGLDRNDDITSPTTLCATLCLSERSTFQRRRRLQIRMGNRGLAAASPQPTTKPTVAIAAALDIEGGRRSRFTAALPPLLAEKTLRAAQGVMAWPPAKMIN